MEVIIKFLFRQLSMFEDSVNLWWKQTLWRLWKNLGQYGKDDRDFMQMGNSMVEQALLACYKPWCLTIVYICIKFAYDWISLEPFKPVIFTFLGWCLDVFLWIQDHLSLPNPGCMYAKLIASFIWFQMSPWFLLKCCFKPMSWLYPSSSEFQVVIFKYWFFGVFCLFWNV